MRYTLLVAVLAAAAGLGFLTGRQTMPTPEKEIVVVPTETAPPTPQPKTAPPPNKKEPKKPLAAEIPLSSIYCANWRKDGLRVPRRKDDEEFTEMWERLRKRLTKLPYRTAFVVQVATIEGAVSDTLDVLDGRREGGEGFRLAEEFGRKDVWAVMFLGNIIGECDVTCTSATYSANELTVTVRIVEDFIESVGISVPHLYWVPLPEVQPGVLTLRIHDSETKTDLLVVRTSIQ